MGSRSKTRRKSDGSQERIYDCPLCGSRGNMEVNSVSGKYHCWSCHSGGRVEVGVQVPAGTPPEPRKTAQDRLPVPGWVLGKVQARGVSEAQLARLRPSWNGRRLVFPVVGGPEWERSVFDWDTPKVVSRSPKGLLGLDRAKRGSHVVLVEGDYKAAVIPRPWIGVAVGGKVLTEYQRGLLLATEPASLTIMLDGGEDKAVEEMLKVLSPVKARVATLPTGCGPDDVPREAQIRSLLA